MFSLQEKIIDRDSIIQTVKEDTSGAHVLFEGWVRNHNEGMGVRSLEYQVYQELAIREGQKILKEALKDFNIKTIQCVHRYGHLNIGETAILIAATATHRDDAYKASRYVIDEIKLRLPIWKKEHYHGRDHQWVFCRDHHTHVHFNSEQYYQKQAQLINQTKLSQAQVTIIGCGGLGTTAMTQLASAGVRRLLLVDFDRVEISNIHRQPLYSVENVGELKVDIAQKKLKALNPFIEVESFSERFDHINAKSLILESDFILDCTDNLETKSLIHDICFKEKKPFCTASVYKYEGQLRTFDPHQNYGCQRCTQRDTTDAPLIGNCNDYGTLGTVVSFFGNLQASEAIQFLLHGENKSLEFALYYNTQKFEQTLLKTFRKLDCLYCQSMHELHLEDHNILISQVSSTNSIMVDIREKEIEDILKFINMKEDIILFCHKGIKSQRFAQEMRSQGHMHFYSLVGGACSL